MWLVCRAVADLTGSSCYSCYPLCRQYCAVLVCSSECSEMMRFYLMVGRAGKLFYLETSAARAAVAAAFLFTRFNSS